MSRSRGGLLLALAATALAGTALAAAGCAAAAPATSPVPPPTPAPHVAGAQPVGRITLQTTSSGAGVACGNYQMPVTADPDSHGHVVFPYVLTVQLCSASGWTHRTVHVLVGDPRHDHTWWGSPAQHGSYIAAAAAAGAVTAAVDPPGTGDSTPLNQETAPDVTASPTTSTSGGTTPAGTPVTAAAVWVLHQLLQALNAGLFGMTPNVVVTVGALGGATTTRAEAADWHDVAGIALLDATRAPAPVAAAVHAAVLVGYSTRGGACAPEACDTTQARAQCAAYTAVPADQCGMAFTTGPTTALAARVAAWAGQVTS